MRVFSALIFSVTIDMAGFTSSMLPFDFHTCPLFLYFSLLHSFVLNTYFCCSINITSLICACTCMFMHIYACIHSVVVVGITICALHQFTIAVTYYGKILHKWIYFNSIFLHFFVILLYILNQCYKATVVLMLLLYIILCP